MRVQLKTHTTRLFDRKNWFEIMVISPKYRFRKYDSIGNPSAESDDEYLLSCFVDTGALEILRACNDQRAIVLGRTGAGKTALLNKLRDTEERVITIDPHSLALSYISNSTVLRFFEALDVKMDHFYRFLWRHVFLVEILKKRFNLESEDQRAGKIDDLVMTLLRKRSHKESFEYLNQYGTSFISNTEEHITEITHRLETDLKAKADINIHDFISLGAEGAKKLSEERKYEVSQRGSEIINSRQANKLSLLCDALDERILDDKGKRYYIVIDKLDENWVDEKTRYLVIKLLIEVAREFNHKISNVKIIIALRADIFERILRNTTDGGFQEEKYKGLCLSIAWDKSQLQDMLDKRIGQLIRHQYSPNKLVTHRDVMSGSIGKPKEAPINYIIDRTLFRPRDVIAFFNICMVVSTGETIIRPQKLLDAEAPYSRGRMGPLADEWSVQYPHLLAICDLLKGRKSCLKLSSIRNSDLDGLCLEILEEVGVYSDRLGEDAAALRDYYNSVIDECTMRRFFARILYHVGIVGLKTKAYAEIAWAYNGPIEFSISDINDDTMMHVHKMVWRALGIVP